MAQPRQPELPDATRSDIARTVSRLLPGGDPLTITFATSDFAPLLKNWMAYAAAAGASTPLVVAMDDRLADQLARAGVASVRHAYDGSLADLWIQRIRFFEFLAREGIDFVHSDVDAVWLRDPRPLCFADAGLDLVFSPGTVYPTEIWQRWGFVLCCGLFAARANPAVADFLAEVSRLAPSIGDDQVVINYLLARNGLAWRTEGHQSHQLSIRGQNFACYRQTLDGFSEPLGLRVGLLPYHLFPRLPTPAPGALVKHPLGPGNPKAKAAVLRETGCWLAKEEARLPADPRGTITLASTKRF
jgi:hypothetical protein